MYNFINIYTCVCVCRYYENDPQNKNIRLALFGILKSARVQKRKCMCLYINLLNSILDDGCIYEKTG